MKNNNTFATVLNVTGVIIIILGIIGSIYLGNIYKKIPENLRDEPKFNITLTITGVVSSFVFGILHIGVAEAIRIANENNYMLNNMNATKPPKSAQKYSRKTASGEIECGVCTALNDADRDMCIKCGSTFSFK